MRGCGAGRAGGLSGALEGVDLDVSTLADHGRRGGRRPGAAARADLPACAGRRAAARRRHDGAGARQGQDITGRLWAYVRDDRPFGQGRRLSSSTTRAIAAASTPSSTSPAMPGILQADAYAGFGRLYAPTRAGGSITEALCWAHARRGFFELADLSRARKGPPSPLALEAVRRIDASSPTSARSTATRRAPARLSPAAYGSAGRRAQAWMRTSVPGSPATPRSPRRWTTCSSAGRPSPASSRTAASA